MAKTVKISEDLYNLICQRQKNFEYFLGEILGYISAQYCRQLKDSVKIDVNKSIDISLSDEICDEIIANFDSTLDISHATNIVMLCGYAMGEL